MAAFSTLRPSGDRLGVRLERVRTALVIAVVTVLAVTSCAHEPIPFGGSPSETPVSISTALQAPDTAPSERVTLDAPISAPPPAPPIPLSRSRPVRLQVPSIGADSPLLDLGLQADGTLAVPPDAASVGWFTGGPTPGELGPAVIVGHVDWAGEPGIFYNLRNLQPDDDIIVTRDDGSVANFVVRSTEQFPKAEFPTGAVYGNIDHAGLRLITCGGSFDTSARSYRDNIVVFADMVEPTTN